MNARWHATRDFLGRPVFGIALWRGTFLVLAVVHTLVIMPVVERLLRGTSDFATFMVLLWIGLTMASLVFLDWLIAWIRLACGAAHRRKLLQIALIESLVLLVVLSRLFGRY